MQSYVAQETIGGYTVKRMVETADDSGEVFRSFYPTDARTFQTFESANRAAEFMAEESDNISFVNMR
jgi:hypothetical protein